MGTRSLTHIKQGDLKSKTLATIYKQFDGYPDGLGQDLFTSFGKLILVNGIRGQKPFEYANGMECLAAQIISHLKEDIGNVYIYPPDSNGVGEEYVYTFYQNEAHYLCLHLHDPYYDRVLFDGLFQGFDAGSIKEEEE